jgi:hypothetical protein
VIVAACAWSVFAIWTETIGGQAFPDFTPNPLFEFSLPKLLSGDIARNAGMLVGMTGFKSLLPLAVVALVAALIAGLPSPRRPRFQRDSTDHTAVTRRPTWA